MAEITRHVAKDRMAEMSYLYYATVETGETIELWGDDADDALEKLINATPEDRQKLLQAVAFDQAQRRALATAKSAGFLNGIVIGGLLGAVVGALAFYLAMAIRGSL